MSRKRGKHIFGMTGAQLAILAILSLTAIAIIYGGFIFISSTSQPGDFTFLPTSEADSPPEVSANFTPDLTDITGLSLTATLDPNEVQIPPDWNQYGNVRIELRVPPQFSSVDVDSMRQKRVNLFREQGANFLAAQLEQDIFEYRFWFNFSQPETVPFITSIIVKAEFLPTQRLAEYIDQAYGGDLQGIEIVDRQIYPVDNLEAERILLVANLNDISLGVADYVITDEINLWIISCWSDFDEFYTWLPEFDKVARSFRLVQ